MSSSASSVQAPPAPPAATTRSWLPCGRLGSGSFGHVSLALNLLDNSLFAIKSCPSASSSSSSSLLNELHILQSLRSPFILRLLGAHFDSSPSSSPLLRSLFLEYMDGGSLADLLLRSGGKLSDESIIARYTRSILQGLDYLHHNGIVHCDIKSQNILISSSGVKIADFGAARRIKADDSSSSMDAGMLRGTPLYMAPEVVQGTEQGPPSDIWSLGCTVVEMLQGRPPWAHISNLAALFLKLGGTEENPPLPELISSEARDFVQICLQRDPKARPTAAELLQHPFLCGKGSSEKEWMKEEKNHKEGESPRSTLRFLETSGWEEESCSSVGMSLITASARSPGSSKSNNTSEGEMRDGWITVKGRRASGEGSVIKQAPFSCLDHEEASTNVMRRRGSQVNLDSAAFLLRNRRRRTVG